MARITSAYTSVFEESLEPNEISKKGRPSHWPPIVHTSGEKGMEPPPKPSGSTSTPPSEGPIENWGEETSPGISSSTSASKPDKSGSSAQETGSSLPSPAPTVENPSRQDPASSPVQSSTAPSTSGSTQETGSSPADLSNSSEEQPTEPASETAATPVLSGHDLLQAAREAYNRKDYEQTSVLLDAALDADPSLSADVEAGRAAVAAVQPSVSAGPSEEDPSAGGFTVA